MQMVVDLEEMRCGLRLIADAVQQGNKNEAEHLLLVVLSHLEGALQEARRHQSAATESVMRALR
jgi:hypothetical protein